MKTVNFKETAGGFKCTIINNNTPKICNTETKFTKGEWVTEEKTYQNTYKYIFVKCNNEIICECTKPFEEGVANSKLIASAPDLLEALSLLYESLPDGYTSDCLPLVRKAIQKATSLSF